MTDKPTDDEKREKLLEIAEVMASVTGDDAIEGFGNLNPQQRKFAVGFCLTGGNAFQAAELAGYAHPKVAGHKLRMNPKISDMIRVLALADAGSTLPVAIATLIDIAEDKTAKPETRRNAALDLAKIANAMQPAGPSVAVQVNASGAGDGAPAPSVVIQNVWQARQERGLDLSSIAPPMLDKDSRDVIDGSARDVEGPGGG